MAKGKKIFLIGCLGCGGFVLLLLILVGGGIGFVAYKGAQFGKEISMVYKDVSDKYTALNVKLPYEPPENGIMPEDRITKFLDIRRDLAAFSTETSQEMEKIGEEIGNQFDTPGIMSKIQGMKTMATIIQKGAKMAAEVGNEHIRLLNEKQMSPKEYQWLMQTYLGTLYKAKENGVEEGTTLWNDYIEKFNKDREKLHNFEMNWGRSQVRGNDINKYNLIESIEHVPFIPANMDIISTNSESFFAVKDIEVLDFLSVRLDKVIEALGKNN